MRGRLCRLIQCAVLFGSTTLAFDYPALAQGAGVTCEVSMVPMRDGVQLHTEIYRPQDTATHPVVVIRNPYAYLFGDGCFVGVFSTIGAFYAQQGYVGVLQEVRGTKNSEGHFNPFFQEQNDGYDTIEWAATQSWSNGKVGTTSASYLGATQWQAAITAPPHLVAISPYETSMDYRDDWVARNGVFDLAFNRGWGTGFVADEITRRLTQAGASQSQISQAVTAWNAQVQQNGSWMSSLPLGGAWGDTIAGGTQWTIRQLAPFNWDWYSHPEYDTYWEAIDPLHHMDEVKVPAQISGGWYDLFTVGTIDSYRGMRTSAGTKAAREGTTLSMDCCGHSLPYQGVPGQINWGPNRTDAGLTLRFLDYHLKGVDNGFAELPRVQLTVLVPPDEGAQGDNFILQADEYPVPGTKFERYYLGSGGNANTRMGDGVLAASGISGAGFDNFIYDPLNPVPTAGGADAEATGGQAAVDQSTIELRRDVLVYTSDVLSSTKEVIGPVSVHFWARTSARDTDFTAKLVDVHPDGYAHNVVDRIVRARYREGSKLPPKLITPGTIYEYELRLGDTATEFRPGHRIRLEISSSNFPHYARNLNTGLSNEDTDRTVAAAQRIFHEDQRASYLVLPVLRLSSTCIDQAHAAKVTACQPLNEDDDNGQGDH